MYMFEICFSDTLGYFTTLVTVYQCQVKILVYQVPIKKKIDEINYLVEEIKILKKEFHCCWLNSIAHVTR